MKRERIVSASRKALLPLVMLFVLLLQSCKSEPEPPCLTCLHDINVPLLEDDPTDYPLVSKLFASIDTIYLENAGAESYVASVDDVKILGDTIIVRSDGTLFFFNRQGQFLSRFSKRGNGYGNYRNIQRFDIRPSAHEMIILDNQNDALFIYDLDGRFKRAVILEDFVTDFVALEDGDFLLTNPIKYHQREYRRGLWLVDSVGKFKRQLVSCDEEFLHVSINNPYLNHIKPGVVGYMGIEDEDYFYSYSGDTMKVTCRMTTDIIMTDDTKKSDKVFTNPKKEYTKCGYLETDRFLYFVATNYGANLVMTLVDKREWKTYRMYVYTEDFNRNAAEVEQFPYLVSCYNGTFVGFFDAGTILSQERYQKEFPTIKEDSNPILLLYNDK